MQDNALRELGLKVTLPRMKVLGVLQAAQTQHLKPEDIYKMLLEQGDDVGLATIYRVLTQFEAAGLVKKHHFDGGYSVYELNDGEHHDHMVCVKCAHVEEFVDEVIESRQRALADEAQFHMTDHSLVIYGLCRTCHQNLTNS